MKNTPLILEIKGNSLDDGPGIRSVVFLKGCPLSCTWCHNPESKKAGVEISFEPGKCVGCNTCIETCTKEALSKENPLARGYSCPTHQNGFAGWFRTETLDEEL